MHYLRVVLLTWLTVVGPFACAGGGTPGAGVPRPSSPMGARDAVAFDQGADFVADAGGLQGHWFASWESDMDQRLSRSDLVAIIAVGSIARSEVQGEGVPTFVLVPEAQEVLRGDFPEDLTLVSAKGSPGYSSIERGQSRLLDGRFVLFVKWALDSEGQVEPRFHLSPASGAVQQRVDAHFGTEGADTKVVHRVN